MNCKHRTALCVATVVAGLLCLATAPAPAQPRRKVSEAPAGAPSPLEIANADYYMRNFEKYIGGLDGKKGTLSRDGRKALEEISKLRKKYPGDEKVAALFERARAALRTMKGVTMEITPEMLAYLDREKQNTELLAGKSKTAWDAYRKKIAASGDAIASPFPAPDPEKVAISSVAGRTVILEGLAYPRDLFRHYGSGYVPIGSSTKGYYYVAVGMRGFVSAYQAVRRYEAKITSDLPEEWVVVGRIVGAQLMIPEAGKQRVMDAQPGWVVDPVAIYVPGRVFAWADEKIPAGGTFAGEANLQQMLESQYTVKAVPDDVEPKQLLAILVTALKERNYDLYFDCVDPANRETIIQKNWLERFYDIFQRRLANDYVHVEVFKIDPVRVRQGGTDQSNRDLLNEFLDEPQREDTREHRLPKIETVTLWLRLYDKTGKVREHNKPLTLRRTENVGKNRWFLYSGYPF